MKSATRVRTVFLCLLFCSYATLSTAAESIPWAKFADGTAVIVMRHALAPGTGDPAEFAIGDCSTQRNLSDVGRMQSQRIGLLIKAQNIQSADVYSSQWCRCVETAAGLELKQPQDLPSLNSFFRDRSTAESQTDELEKWIKDRLEKAEKDPMLPAVLVTHQVNITALTKVYPRSGEMIFVGVEGGKLVVLGSQLTE